MPIGSKRGQGIHLDSISKPSPARNTPQPREEPTIVVLLLHHLGDSVIDLLVVCLRVSHSKLSLGGSSQTSSIGTELLGGISGRTFGTKEQVGTTGCQGSDSCKQVWNVGLSGWWRRVLVPNQHAASIVPISWASNSQPWGLPRQSVASELELEG